jgi:hypothetical protein
MKSSLRPPCRESRRASTTLDIYQQFVPESQQRVVEKLSRLTDAAAMRFKDIERLATHPSY